MDLTTSKSPSSLEKESDDGGEHHLDYLETPLNPCSVESIPTPITIASEETTRTRKPKRVWPVMVGCYELQDDQITRKGYLDLFSIEVPMSDITNDTTSTSNGTIEFGTPHNVIGKSIEGVSGILDGKWWYSTDNNKPSQNSAIMNNSSIPLYYYATAHSSGEIMIHSVMASSNDDENQPPFQTQLVGKSPSCDDGSSSSPGLCLSLNWDRPSLSLFSSSSSPSMEGATSIGNDDACPSSKVSNRIISTYSNGIVKIHNVSFPSKESSGADSVVQVEFSEEYSWLGHTMFQNHPSEVWTACFVTTTAPASGGGSTRDGDEICNSNNTNLHTNNLVLSGGDEGNLKLWDLNCIASNNQIASRNKPIRTFKDFDAGVTVLSPHPKFDYIVACGSYDETIAIYDIRYCQTEHSQKSPLLFRSAPLGGGMWRIKWHPYDDNRLLLGAMHGGCRVVTVQGLVEHVTIMEEKKLNSETVATASEEGSTSNIKIIVEQEFTKHKSMAYGADWLVGVDDISNRSATTSSCSSSGGRGSFNGDGEHEQVEEVEGVGKSSSYNEAAASCSFYDRALYLWNVKKILP